MTPQSAVHYLESLVDRLDAKLSAFKGLVSSQEHNALKWLLERARRQAAATESAPALTPTASASTFGAARAREGIVVRGPSAMPVPPAPAPQSAPKPKARPTVKLDLASVNRDKVDKPDLTLCVDFGTAQSKACVAEHKSGSDATDYQLIEIGLGLEDGDQETVYPVSSSVWIDDDGLMWFGAEAIRRSSSYKGTKERARLDSLKHWITIATSESEITELELSEQNNPTREPLTIDDLVTMYLAYITDLSTTAIHKKRKARYVSRRFTLPCWPDEHRTWSLPYLASRIRRAQVLADTFHGQWRSGVPVAKAADALRAVAEYDSAVAYLLDRDKNSDRERCRFWGGVLEPIAAGSSRLWRERNFRELVLTLDVGAGTTDLALSFVVQNRHSKIGVVGHRAIPVAPTACALPIAGDYLDQGLLELLLARAGLAHGTDAYLRAAGRLRLTGARRLKEQLFRTGTLATRVGDKVIQISKSQFLASSTAREFEQRIRRAMDEFVGQLHPTWKPNVDRITLVATGGSSRLPFIEKLNGSAVPVLGRTSKLVAAPMLPEELEEYSDRFQEAYPQMAVAIGGCCPTLMNEQHTIVDWQGGVAAPGPLTRYATKGI